MGYLLLLLIMLLASASLADHHLQRLVRHGKLSTRALDSTAVVSLTTAVILVVAALLLVSTRRTASLALEAGLDHSFSDSMNLQKKQPRNDAQSHRARLRVGGRASI